MTRLNCKSASSDHTHFAVPTHVTFFAFLGDCEEPIIVDSAYTGSTSEKRTIIDYASDIPHIHQYIRTMTNHVKDNKSDFYMAVADSGTTKHLVDQDDDFVK